MTSLAKPLAKHLTHLESTGLLRLAQTHPELEYLFRHALVQDAAYESLLLADRKQLHRQVGEILERLYPDRLASRELAATLAHHFAVAGDNYRALKYFTQAGDADADVYANAEAVDQYTRALEIALRAEASSEELTYLYTNLGRVLELNSQFEQAMATYQEMEQVATQNGDRSLELTALVHQSQLRCTPNELFNPEQGETLSERALAMAQELGDRAAEAKILRNLVNLYRHTGRIPQAIECGERTLALARELDLREQLAFTLNDIAGLYSELGPAIATIGEASDLWRELDNLPMLADSLAYACWLHSFAGDYEAAVAYSDEGFKISQVINNPWGQSYSRYMVGLVYWNRGELDRAVEVMEEAIRLGAEAGFVVPGVTTRCWLALLYGDLGAAEVGIEIANKAVAAAKVHWARDLGFALACLARLYLLKGDVSKATTIFQQADNDSEPLNDHWAQLAMWLRGRLALAQGHPNQAVALAIQCVTELRQFHKRIFFIPDVLYLQGQALLAMDQSLDAYECLVEARAEAEVLGSRRSLWKILAVLSEIEAQQGNSTEAAMLCQQAREIVEYIADHTPAALRDSFLGLPEVARVWGGKKSP